MNPGKLSTSVASIALCLGLLAGCASSRAGGKPEIPDPTVAASVAYYDLIGQADSLYKIGDYAASAKYYKKALGTPDVTPRWPLYWDYYNGACASALAGNHEDALTMLGRSIDHGQTNVNAVRTDSALVGLRGEPGWDAVLKRLQAKVDEYGALIDELDEMLERDQLYRRQGRSVAQEYGADSEEMRALTRSVALADSLNLMRLEQIVDEYGWPRISMVGYNGSQTAFVIIQHSDHETRERYLPMMTEQAERGELMWSSLALLIDRVLVYKGEQQIYGSHTRLNPETQEHEVYPIVDEANVNRRRARVGLQPLEEYLKHWNIDYIPVDQRVDPDHED